MKLKSKATDTTTAEQEKANLKNIKINQLKGDIKQKEGLIRIQEEQGNTELVELNKKTIARHQAELAELKGE